jgi:hypothetical protein
MSDAFEVGHLEGRFLKGPTRVEEVRAPQSEQKSKGEEKANRYRRKLKFP